MDLGFGFGYGGDRDAIRYCYLRATLVEKLLSNARVLDALLDELEVPGPRRAVLKKKSDAEKLQMVEHQIEHFRGTKTSRWYDVHPAEVFAASIYRSDLPERFVLNEIFSDVRREADLAAPVTKWLVSKGYNAYSEVPMGTKRIDLLGYKKGLLGHRMKARFLGLGSHLIGVELKNEHAQMARGLDQMTTFREYVDAMYLACTPAMAAEYLARHADGKKVLRYDPDVLKRKLESFGFGLLIVEGDAVFEVTAPKESAPGMARMQEVKEAIAGAKASVA
jgi:hypothetical protein